MNSKYMKQWLMVLLLLILTLTMASCGNSIVGTWTNSLLGYETTITFGNDGTFSISTLGILAGTGNYSIQGNNITLSGVQGLLNTSFPDGTSTYSISGKQLILDGIVYTKK